MIESAAVVVPIGTIIRLPELQARKELDSGVITRYATALGQGAVLPPVSVSRCGGRLYLTDGWHRLAAVDARGEPQVHAVISEAATMADVRLAAAGANTAHGLALKPSEHRKRLKLFLHGRGNRKPDGALMSYREITQAFGGGVAYTTVRNWIMQDYPKLAARMKEPGREWSPDWSWSPPERRLLREQVARIPAQVLPAVRALHAMDPEGACEELRGVLERLTGELRVLMAGAVQSEHAALSPTLPLATQPGLTPENTDF